MAPNDLEEQLTKYLTDVHSIEQQALAQMKLAPGLAGDAEIGNQFSQHLIETEDQRRLIRERLEARNATPSKVKDVAGTTTGVGFALFAKAQPDTPGKLVAHAFSYEHLEIAAYELLRRVAERLEDRETAAVSERIMVQEREAAERIRALLGQATEASLHAQDVAAR